MTVTKVVGFDLRIPKHFILHFYDFSTILYGIYKFAVFENKRKRKRTFASRPLEVCFFSGKVPGGRDRTEESLRGVFRRGEAPEVGARLGKIERSSSRTCRWSRWGLGWPVAGCPRAPAAGSGPVPRLRHSGEGEAAWLGLRAPLGRGEAVPGVDWSCGRAEVGARRGAGGRRRSEPRRRRSDGLGWWGNGRRAARGLGETNCRLRPGEGWPERGPPREQNDGNGACGALSDGEEGARLWNRQNGE